MNARPPITEDDLQSYIDGALDAERRLEVETFLEAHPAVANRVAADIEVRDRLRLTLGRIADEPLPERLDLARITRSSKVPARSWRAWPSQAAAAIALLFIGAAGGWTLHAGQAPPKAGIGSLAEEAADTYDVYAGDENRAVEIRAAQAGELVRWGSQRLARPLAIPDLSASGFEFIGGRVVPTPHGPAVLYMFNSKDGMRLALLTRNMAVDRDEPMISRPVGPGTSISWSRRGLGFSLVGPIDESRMRSIADSVSRQLDRTA